MEMVTLSPAGLLASRVFARALAFPGSLPVARVGPSLAAHSCGGSRGFGPKATPRSHSIPIRGTVDGGEFAQISIHSQRVRHACKISMHAYACNGQMHAWRFPMTDEPKKNSKAAGGHARAKALSPSARSSIAKAAALSRWEGKPPVATHDGNIKLGDLMIECAVLEDGRRVISERAMTRAFGGKRGGSHWTRTKEGGPNLPVYLSAKNFAPFISKDLANALDKPIRYRTPTGALANGLDAQLLPEVCNVFLKARDNDQLHPKQIPLSKQADIIMRGLATVGIIALIDEATGYQRERAVDALALILEKFIAKELRPWVKTFPDEFYEELYRLRGLDFPNDTMKKPSYFGHLTNDIIYRRLAPGVLNELKRLTPKAATGRHKHHLHRRLSGDIGNPKLAAHLDSVITVMKLTDDNDYDAFIEKLDRVKPRFGKTMKLPFPDR